MSAETPTPDAPKKRKLWLVPVVALLIGSVGAGAVTQSATLRQTLGVSALVASDSTAAAKPAEFGQFTELDGIVVNPRGTDGRRYLMIKVGIEAKDAKTLTRIDELRPAAVDAIIELMSAQSVEVLSDITKREALKDAVLTQFNEMLGKDGPVTRVYFTQYVLQ